MTRKDNNDVFGKNKNNVNNDNDNNNDDIVVAAASLPNTLSPHLEGLCLANRAMDRINNLRSAPPPPSTPPPGGGECLGYNTGVVPSMVCALIHQCHLPPSPPIASLVGGRGGGVNGMEPVCGCHGGGKEPEQASRQPPPLMPMAGPKMTTMLHFPAKQTQQQCHHSNKKGPNNR